jgi:hypothetical protein
MISRLRRLLFPELEVHVTARQVDGPPWPEETRITTDLRDVRFEPETLNVELEGVTAERVDFSGLRFHSFLTERCRFIDCDFSDVHVEWLPFGDGGSLFRECSFRGASIGDFGHVRLERCDFTDADLKGWFTWDADLVECRFGGRLSGVVFNGRDLESSRQNKFVGNDFRDADLDDVAFRLGIDLDAQLLPEGSEYIRIRNLPFAAKQARDQVRRWPKPDREAAVQMLDVLGRVYEGEPDVFTKRAFLLEMSDSAEVGERVLGLLG